MATKCIIGDIITYDDDGNEVITRGSIHVEMTDEEIVARDAANTTTLEEKLSELAALRYTKETSGIVVDGVSISTDRESQAMISGAYCACIIDTTRIIDFKSVNGWVQLTASEITSIASAVAMHVQSCFTREKELAALLDMDINTDLTTGWPI